MTRAKPTDAQNVKREAIFHLVESARQIAKISQYALCAKAGINQSTYWRWTQAPHAWRRRQMRLVVRALKELRAVDDAKVKVFEDAMRALAATTTDPRP